jgi:hypothetical protein
MNKKVWIVFFTLLIFIWGVYSLNGSYSEDYKVVKRAVKGKKSAKDVTYFKILVKDKARQKVKVRLTLPIALIELISECSDDSFKLKSDCGIDLKTIIRELKKMGPQCFIEIDDGDESIKIWFE